MWGMQPLTEPVAFDGARLEKILWALRAQDDLLVLLGAPSQGEVGRYGLVAVPEVSRSWRTPPDLDEVWALQKGKLALLGLSYEYGEAFNHLPAQSAPRGQPTVFLSLFKTAILFDFIAQTYVLLGEKGTQAELLQQACASQEAPAWPKLQGALQALVDDQEHARRIEVTKAHIRAGDIYQANITRRLKLETTSFDALALLCRLQRTNPVAHGAYVRLSGFEMLSNSMETLLTYDGANRQAVSYPIKGTCARSGDEKMPVDLSLDAKEKAEHVMIVDLVRNDLGKVCQTASVQVSRLMGIDGFFGVWHGVSQIHGKLALQHTGADLIRAVFPGGSITGAPKRRAMQIISQLEGEGRGFYTGSLALLTPQDTISMSILIRTLVKDDEGWSLSVGGGIVAKSVAAREIEETWEKVAIFKEVLSQALDGA
jgi:para-aminobenzoate synthetase component 1